MADNGRFTAGDITILNTPSAATDAATVSYVSTHGGGTVVTTGGVVLTNARYVALTVQTSGATGNVDMTDAATGSTYVVPVGKIALYNNGRTVNQNGSSATIYLALKSGGSYYQLNASASVSSGVIGGLNLTGGCVIAIAGEGFAFNSTQTTISAWCVVIEADATSSLKPGRSLGLGSGNNTVYTCPALKSAVPCQSNYLISGPQILIINGTVGSLNYTVHLVKSGGSPATANIIAPLAAIGPGAFSSVSIPGCFSPGDYLNILSSGAGAGQLAFAAFDEL